MLCSVSRTLSPPHGTPVRVCHWTIPVFVAVMLSWFFVVFVCLCAYTTITCRSLPVCAPMIIAAPDLAFYECLCERLLHPPSTMTAWNDPLSMAFLFSSPAASFMLYSSDSRHDRPCKSLLGGHEGLLGHHRHPQHDIVSAIGA